MTNNCEKQSSVLVLELMFEFIWWKWEEKVHKIFAVLLSYWSNWGNFFSLHFKPIIVESFEYSTKLTNPKRNSKRTIRTNTSKLKGSNYKIRISIYIYIYILVLNRRFWKALKAGLNLISSTYVSLWFLFFKIANNKSFLSLTKHYLYDLCRPFSSEQYPFFSSQNR